MKRALLTAAFGLLICSIAYGATPTPVEFNYGASMSGGLLRILDSQHGAFSVGSASSPNYRLLSTIGDLAIGTSSYSGGFGLESGFLYYPVIVAPSLSSVVAGNAQVTVSWSGAQTQLGLDISSYNVCWKLTSAGTWPSCQYQNVVASPQLVTGLTNGTSYTFKVQVVHKATGYPSSEHVIAESDELTATPTGGGGGGGGGGGYIPTPTPTMGAASVVLTGLAYPTIAGQNPVDVHIMVNGTEIGTSRANANAVFQYTTSGLPTGPVILAFWAVDADGRRSVTWSFLVTLTGSGVQRIDGIIVPPSIQLSATSVAPGDTITVSGTTVPRSTARIEYAPGRQVTVLTGTDGRYRVVVDTDGLSPGVYEAKTRVEFPPAGDKSTWSQLVPYGVGVQPPAQCTQNPDINRDSRVDLVDFSILAFWWKKSVPLGSPQDQNCDRIISLADFSILAYHWSGRR